MKHIKIFIQYRQRIVIFFNVKSWSSRKKLREIFEVVIFCCYKELVSKRNIENPKFNLIFSLIYI